MAQQHGLVVVEGQPGIEAGATVWWSLSGTIQHSNLRAAWLAQGLPEAWLPDLPSAERQLGRAVRTITDLRLLARPISRRGHWGIIEEVVVEGSERLTHRQILSCKIVNDRPQFDVYTSLAARIDDAFAAQAGVLDRDDVALWLARVISHVYGTPLRPRGGLYYVLPAQTDRWRAVARAVEAAGAGRCYTLPTLRGEEATRAVLDALVHDVEGTAAEYSDIVVSGVGERALRARVADCDALLDKLSQYEGLLGGALDRVKAKVVSVQDAALAAAFAAAKPATTALPVAAGWLDDDPDGPAGA